MRKLEAIPAQFFALSKAIEEYADTCPPKTQKLLKGYAKNISQRARYLSSLLNKGFDEVPSPLTPGKGV
jgi:hypothetical protein